MSLTINGECECGKKQSFCYPHLSFEAIVRDPTIIKTEPDEANMPEDLHAQFYTKEILQVSNIVNRRKTKVYVCECGRFYDLDAFLSDALSPLLKS